jgi:DNA-directed RNA polymerase alpha subunit
MTKRRIQQTADNIAFLETADDMIDPTPDLPDSTPISIVRLPTRIRNALSNTELKTVGDVRKAPDRVLFSLQNIGHGSLRQLRRLLGVA